MTSAIVSVMYLLRLTIAFEAWLALSPAIVAAAIFWYEAVARWKRRA
jgi:hypothetical protein